MKMEKIPVRVKGGTQIGHVLCELPLSDECYYNVVTLHDVGTQYPKQMTKYVLGKYLEVVNIKTITK
jgi:hypothetical protein